MRKFMVLALGAVFAFCLFAHAAMAADKLAYVDLTKVFSEYSKTKDYDKLLQEKTQAYETERDKMVSDVKQFQDKMNLLSDKEKETKKTELEAKIKSLQEFDRQKQTDLRKEQDEKMKELLKDINEAIKQVAQKEGYTFIFNERLLVYQDKTLDITDKVVDAVNSKSASKK